MHIQLHITIHAHILFRKTNSDYSISRDSQASSICVEHRKRSRLWNLRLQRSRFEVSRTVVIFSCSSMAGDSSISKGVNNAAPNDWSFTTYTTAHRPPLAALSTFSTNTPYKHTWLSYTVYISMTSRFFPCHSCDVRLPKQYSLIDFIGTTVSGHWRSPVSILARSVRFGSAHQHSAHTCLI